MKVGGHSLPWGPSLWIPSPGARLSNTPRKMATLSGSNIPSGDRLDKSSPYLGGKNPARERSQHLEGTELKADGRLNNTQNVSRDGAEGRKA